MVIQADISVTSDAGRDAARKFVDKVRDRLYCLVSEKPCADQADAAGYIVADSSR